MTTEDSWSWEACETFYREYLGIDVRPAPVDNIIWMRNKMAHLRTELRTREGVAEFKSKLADLDVSGPTTEHEARLGLENDAKQFVRGVEINLLQTYRILGLLRAHVGQVAETLYRLSYGDEPPSLLQLMTEGTLTSFKSSGFNADRLIGFSKAKMPPF